MAGAQILNPAYSLPLSRYEREGHQIVMYGNPDMTLEGHVNGACPPPVLLSPFPFFSPARANSRPPTAYHAVCGFCITVHTVLVAAVERYKHRLRS